MWLVLAAIAISGAEGRCANVPVVQGFQPAKYLGQWYEIASSPLVKGTFERDCACTNARYGLFAAGNVSVTNKCSKGSASGPISTIQGYATLGAGADAAKLTVHLDGHGGNYWVVSVSDTGALYDDAIVWSCESFIVNLEWLWILSRNRTMSESRYQALLTKAQAITGYPAPQKVTRTNQTGCPAPQ